MKIFSQGFWAGRLNDVRLTALRFPLPVACCVVFAALTVLKNHDFFLLGKADDLAAHLWALVCGFFLLGALRLTAESRGWSDERWLATGLPLLGALWFYLVFAQSLYGILPFLFPALLLFVTVAPYLGARGDEKSFWYFNYQLWWQAGFGGAVTIVLCAGVAAILATLEYLFGIGIADKIYFDVWALGFSIFWPLLALSGVPRQFIYEDNCEYPRSVNFLVTWILVPLIAVYLLILYAYALKIALMWELPKGKLGYMVSGFGIIGITTYLIAFPLKDKAQGLIRVFFDRFYPALLLPVGLLLLAVFVRIRELGVTENRYAVIVAALWFFAMSVWFILKKNTVHIKYNPMVLAVLGLLASFGPWSASSVSTASQLGRLEAILVRYGMFVEGKIVPAKNAEVPFEDRKAISSIVEYMTDSDRFESLRPWLTGLEFSNSGTQSQVKSPKKHPGYINVENVVSAMGIAYVSPWESRQDSSSFSFSGNWKTDGDLQDISGFEHMFFFRASFSAARSADFTRQAGTLTLNIRGANLRFVSASGDEVSFDLDQTIEALRQSGAGHSVPDNLRHLLVLDGEKNGLRVRVFIEQIFGQRLSDGEHINQIEATVFFTEQR